MIVAAAAVTTAATTDRAALRQRTTVATMGATTDLGTRATALATAAVAVAVPTMTVAIVSTVGAGKSVTEVNVAREWRLVLHASRGVRASRVSPQSCHERPDVERPPCLFDF